MDDFPSVGLREWPDMPGTVLVSRVEGGRRPTPLVRITQSASAILAGASCCVKREGAEGHTERAGCRIYGRILNEIVSPAFESARRPSPRPSRKARRPAKRSSLPNPIIKRLRIQARIVIRVWCISPSCAERVEFLREDARLRHALMMHEQGVRRQDI